MSQDWMKFEKATLEKPEVFRIASTLGIDRDSVVGKLLRVWSYFDTQTTDGVLKGSDAKFLDGIVGLAGFSAAMIEVRWLFEKRGSLTLPNFDRHNGETAKQRALSAIRMARKRKGEKDKPGYANVTHGVTHGSQPEEIREEKNKRRRFSFHERNQSNTPKTEDEILATARAADLVSLKAGSLTQEEFDRREKDRMEKKP